VGTRELHPPPEVDRTRENHTREHRFRADLVTAGAGPDDRRPLAGTHVLDLTSSLAGPYCTQILSALGADVVKVEHPERGDEARAWGPQFFAGGSVMFFAANAGKRSLALDLKAPAGRDALLRLADRADVFIESMRPGAAARLGLGADELRARNPGLVHCSVGAYGRGGPLSQLPGYDPLMQAASGIVSLTGEPGREGVRVGTSLIDQGTGTWAALAILAALTERARTGLGATVDLSLYETALALVGYHVADFLGSGRRPTGRLGTAFPLIAPYEVFETADGSLMVAAANDRLFAALCDALGLGELAADARFATNPLRVEHRAELLAPLAARFRERDTADWLAHLERAGVPAAPVREIPEVAEHEQTRALGILQPLDGREIVGIPFSLDGARPAFASPPPLLGQHSAEVLVEAGYSDAEVDALAADGIVRLGDR
jgi:crotonobetainyl-CoA:carnitine CoA-transferase CaiB-like acyl-CoA transferase